MAASTWTWLGSTSDPTISSNWTLTAGPGNVKNKPQGGDTAIFTGAGVAPALTDTSLTSTTLILNTGGVVDFNNDTTTLTTTGIDAFSTIIGDGTTGTLAIAGPFTNNGTIEVIGTGANLAITVGAGSAAPGQLVNNGTILVASGDKLTISGGTLFDTGAIAVNGTAIITDTPSGLANYGIGTGGSLELNQTGSLGLSEITFTGTTGLLKLDNPSSFNGAIANFALGDTIDLGNTTITSVVFDGQGDITALHNSTTVFFASAGPGGGVLGNNGNSGTFTLSGTGGLAGDLRITEGGGDTTITGLPPSTWLWLGGSGNGGSPASWSLLSGSGNGNGTPGAGDTAIVPSGTLSFGTDPSLTGNTLEVGGTASVAALSGVGDFGATVANPSVSSNSLITSQISSVGTYVAPATAEATLIQAQGVWVNDGTILADGPAGSTFTIAVSSGSIVNNGTTTFVPGYFINDSQIIVDAGNTMTIAVAGTSEFINASEIEVNGGTLIFNASTGAFAGGYGPLLASVVIDGGGRVETNSAFSSTTSGTFPLYAFADSTAGNTLKIDTVGSFDSVIYGFGLNDTIDISQSLAVGEIVYSSTTGLLNLENAGGTILDTLVLGSGNFATGTFAVSGGAADGITITNSGTDTLLTTTVQNDTYNSTSGTWQTAGNWSLGQPGPLDTALIGIGASSNFTLTTGSSPVSVGQIGISDNHALLQITSATTTGPYSTRIFAGELEVTSGNTLTTPSFSMSSGTVVVDPGAVLDLTGHIGSTFGSLTVSNGNTTALFLAGGTVLVNGGIINAGTGQTGGNGGRTVIGASGGGTPATITVQSSGTNAATVTDTYTLLGSDPTSFGALTLNGNGTAGGVEWTDEIDPHDTTTRGFIQVGVNQQAANSGTFTQLPYSGGATLTVENGATLTEQSYAQIATGSNSAGTVLVSDGLWNIGAIGGFLQVGLSGSGTVTVANSGTVAVGNGISLVSSGTTSANLSSGIGVGVNGGAHGLLTVEGAGALLTDQAGLNVGQSGTGELDILNGGTIKLTGTNGANVGQNGGALGVVMLAGTDQTTGASSVLSFGTATGGFNVGVSAGSRGTLDIESGGTFSMNGTGQIAAGRTLGSTGLIIVDGPSALINLGTNSGGMSIGQGGAGTLEIENGGSVVINTSGTTGNLGVGTSSGASGLVVVTGTNSELFYNNSTQGIFVGQSGAGTLEVLTGGTVSDAGQMGIGTNLGSLTPSGTGSVVVSGIGAEITLTGTSSLNIGSPGTGALSIGAGGLVATKGGVFIASGNTTTSSGTVTVNSGGTLNDSGSFIIGSSGSGTLLVQGGVVNAGTNGLTIGFGAGASGLLVINGGTVNDPAFFTLGGTNSRGSLLVEGGGTLINSATSFFPVIDATGTGQATAFVTGGTWDTAGGLIIGNNGTGSLDISSNGLVLTTGTNGITIGNNTGAVGILTVENNGTLNSNSGLSVGSPIGGSAGGTLDVGDAGTVLLGGLSLQRGGNVILGGGTHAAVLTDSGFLNVGQSGTTAILSVNQAGTVNMTGTGQLQIGSNTNTSGTVVVNGGTLTGANGISIGGLNSSGTLIVDNGGLVVSNSTTQGIFVGNGFGTLGTGSGLLVINGGTLSETGSSFNLGGSNTTGSLLVEGGGVLTTNLGTFSSVFNGSGTGQALATISGGTWNLGGGLFLGQSGSGSIDINSNGLLNAGTNSIDVGMQPGASGTISLETGGTLLAGGVFLDTDATGLGNAALNVAGGTVVVGNLSVNGNSGVTVSSGSLTVNGAVGIGQSGTNASLAVSGGRVSTGSMSLAQNFGSSGTLAVSGGTLSVTQLTVGSQGSGTATVTGGSLSASSIQIATGLLPGSAGMLTINHGAVSDSGMLSVGGGGNATLTVGSGGTLTQGGTATGFASFDIGSGLGGSDLVDVNGGIITTQGTSAVVVGNGGNGTLLIEGGGTVITGFTGFGPGVDINASGTAQAGATVTGAGSVWDVNEANAQFIVGDGGKGSLTIGTGGTVNVGGTTGSTDTVIVGNQSGGSGTVVVGSTPALFDGTGVTTAAELFGGTLDIGTASGATGIITVNGSAGIQFGSLAVGTGGTLVLAGGLVNLFGPGTNAGLITGQGEFSGGITNTGTVLATGGLLDMGAIDGNGLIEIAGGATLDLTSTEANSGAVTFGTSASSETLAINLVNSGSFGINNWQIGDKLQISGVTGAQWMGGGTLDVSTGTGGLTFTNVNLASGALPIFTTGTNFVELVACFTPGTLIRTTDGDVAVEDLVEGDMLPTGIDGSVQPVVWIGHRTVNCAAHPQPRTVWPVRISAGAFGPAMPERDLILSPDHAVYVNEVLVPVKHLINGSTIVQTPVDRITYYHIELPQHDVVFAEGLPAESYLDVGDRPNFANNGAVVRMHIDLAQRWEAEGCAPLVIAGPGLAAARACVAAAQAA